VIEVGTLIGLLIGCPLGSWLGFRLARYRLRKYRAELEHANRVIEEGLFPADEGLQERYEQAIQAERAAARARNEAQKERQQLKAQRDAMPIPASQDPSPPQFYGDGSIRTPKHIKSLASWERSKLAIERARRGLPPNDGLEGLPSWEISKIERARMKGPAD
jgi:hypothetical protein